MYLLLYFSLVHLHVEESTVFVNTSWCIISQENKGHEVLSPKEVWEKNPVPAPRSKKERVNQDNKGQVKNVTDPFPTHLNILETSPLFSPYYSIIW